MPPPSRSWLDVKQVAGVTVIGIKARGVLDPETAEAIGEQVLNVLEEHGAARLVVDLSTVETMNSLMLGNLINLHKKAEADGGRLALCHVHPKLQEVFDVFRLPRLLHIYADEAEALRSFGAA